jgi:hypothetical protein
MNAHLEGLFHTYVSRRSPWGPPWWIYGVSFAMVNAARQAVILMSGAAPPAVVGVAAWLASALIVIAVINAVAVARRAPADGASSAAMPPLRPLWPLHRRVARDHDAHVRRSPPATSTSESSSDRQPMSTRWAPWWVYLVVIVGANYVRRAVGVDPGTPALRVVSALAIGAVLFVVITVLHRARRTNP